MHRSFVMASMKCYFVFVIISLLLETGYSIECYQCSSISSKFPFQCNELLTSDVDLQPESCDDVYGAQYCVKHIGRFEAMTLECYQCSSEDEWKCMNSDLVETSLVPTNCDHIHEARYCVKTIGRYGGGIGTKRFCSSVHMGNYCDYVKQPGDKLIYRTCVFTCSSDGCNPATYLQPNSLYTSLIPVSLLIMWNRQFYR